jgi:hypothetical protein
MQAHADAVVAVMDTVDQAGDHLGMDQFLSRRGAIFAIEGDVEVGAKLLLQSHRLAHQLFRAGVVIAGGKHQRLAFALE